MFFVFPFVSVCSFEHDMSDSIYCRLALIYSNFRIRWKVSWLIWSVLVMWTSLFACCALFHNTRQRDVRSANIHFFSLFRSFVPVTFCGDARCMEIQQTANAIRTHQHHPNDLPQSMHFTAFDKLFARCCWFFVHVCLSSVPALVFFCYATNKRTLFFK